MHQLIAPTEYGPKILAQNVFCIYVSKEKGSEFTAGGIPKKFQGLRIPYYDNEIIPDQASGYLSNYWMLAFTEAKLG